MTHICARRPLRAGRGALAALALLTLAGCAKQDFHKTYPVKGQILVGGQPAADCLVYLHRTFDDTHPRRVTPNGLTGENGVFRITSYVPNDGAPEGEYILTVEWRERSGLLKNNLDGIDRLDGAYAKPDKTKALPGFVIKVGRQPLELPPLELTQTPEAKRKHEEWKKKPQRNYTTG